MAVSHGMNIEEVRQMGRMLQSKSDEITGIINGLQSLIDGTTWMGPDANEFKGPWWSGHRSHLQNIANDLHGFGQSALNNAADQEAASGR